MLEQNVFNLIKKKRLNDIYNERSLDYVFLVEYRIALRERNRVRTRHVYRKIFDQCTLIVELPSSSSSSSPLWQ